MTKVPEPFVGAAYDSLKIVISRAGQDKEIFINDAILEDATLMRLMDAGEQLSRVRETFPEYYASHSSASWDKLIGLRNIIAHGYLVIDYGIIWDIIHDYLPKLVTELEELI